MNIRFDKMEGCGNDYIYIDGSQCMLSSDAKPDFVRKVSDRHFGIGSDGVIFINSSEIADFEMEMWNSDGTRAEMCGNGIRCVAKFVFDHKMVSDECAASHEVDIESMGKIKHIKVTLGDDGMVKLAEVDMGEPILEPSLVPVNSSSSEPVVNAPIVVDGKEYRMTCVSMGNPHAVVFEDPDTVGLHEVGPKFENHECFPKRTNTEFVRVIDECNVRMRVWERGAGETLACGTGCCATVVACVLNGKTSRAIDVHLLGGIVNVRWDEETNHVIMTGPATTVFEGNIEY